ALTISGIPFNGPIGAARVGYIDDQYVLNPTVDELKSSRLDLVVAGTSNAVLMVESEADLLTEEQMLGAVIFGYEQQQIVIKNINTLAAETGKEKWNWQPESINQELHKWITELAEQRLGYAYRISEKQERYTNVNAIKEDVTNTLLAKNESLDP
ncbi:MAG: polyribonucleotide nucleotidyltransferase, partial [Arsenophonus sp. NC-QC1-MAG3]